MSGLGTGERSLYILRSQGEEVEAYSGSNKKIKTRHV